MTSALTPAQGLAYLAELQPGATGVALGARGTVPAGAAGSVHVRSENQEIVAIPPPDGLAGLLAYDCERLLEVVNP